MEKTETHKELYSYTRKKNKITRQFLSCEVEAFVSEERGATCNVDCVNASRGWHHNVTLPAIPSRNLHFVNFISYFSCYWLPPFYILLFLLLVTCILYPTFPVIGYLYFISYFCCRSEERRRERV